MGKGWMAFEAFRRQSLDCFEESIGRNMDAEGDVGEDSCVVGSMVKNASIILENVCTTMNSMLVSIQRWFLELKESRPLL